MAEIVGLVASIWSLAQVAQGVAVCVRRVSELDKAPTQIQALQEQLCIFQRVLLAADAASQGHENDVLRCAISKTPGIMDELLQVLTIKLIKQGSGSGRARRRAWLRHKTKINSLKNKLTEAREGIFLALSTDIL
ncbi:hypothetical protein B0J13DRAFT_625105 [Dactylonectria estremocensis]|uniref:NACHT-NTPase and P-loop NTPases N-terminal domain-containing protein n=1 Tax=Dactylonectria estremocensis TaxID=1079267 RepID=A0A9P9EHS3_9HYPO|nr:hypothetical protein B0J13DRAFT_625105 [Dactylonectria estremocensis]